MSISIRPAKNSDLPTLSALCLRSKAHWNYDDTFLEACREELTLKPGDLVESNVLVATWNSKLAGVVQMSIDGSEAELLKLFIDPSFMAKGIGKTLFDHCVEHARQAQAKSLRVEADPDAKGFYERMGAIQIGEVPSGSIPNRYLPLLSHSLK